MSIDGLARFYSLAVLKEIRRRYRRSASSFIEKHGAGMKPFYLARIENALDGGWDEYTGFVSTHLGNRELRDTVEVLAEAVRHGVGAIRLALEGAQISADLLALPASPLFAIANLLLSAGSSFGLRRAVTSRAVGRLLWPYRSRVSGGPSEHRISRGR